VGKNFMVKAFLESPGMDDLKNGVPNAGDR
jgi:hypothetical protein